MELVQISIDKSVAKKMLKAGWVFDWNLSSGAVSRKIGYFEQSDLQGLVEFERVPDSLYNFIYLIELAPWNKGKKKRIEDVAGVLFAYVAKDSILAGYDGFVVFHSKTILVNHYIKKYGAKIIQGDRLMFDASASKKIIKEYLKETL